MADSKEKYSGIMDGKPVTFNREWAGHRFTNEECEKLCRGEEIELDDAVSAKTGKQFSVRGKLTEQEFHGRPFIGFARTGSPIRDIALGNTDKQSVRPLPTHEDEYTNEKSVPDLWRDLENRRVHGRSAEPDFGSPEPRSHSKVASAVGTVGKVAAGTAILGGAAAVGGALTIANKSKAAMKKATGNIEDGLMAILLDTMSYSSLEERVARNGIEKSESKKRPLPSFRSGSSKDGGMSL